MEIFKRTTNHYNSFPADLWKVLFMKITLLSGENGLGPAAFKFSHSGWIYPLSVMEARLCLPYSGLG
jgi:hypothetical protein